MVVNEVAKLIQLSFGKLWTREDVIAAITDGVTPKGEADPIKLRGVKGPTGYEVEETDLDAFFAVFEANEPGRHPPVSVRRELLTEARHTCGICEKIGPIEFHHILEFSTLKHHDPRHMIAACPTCHARCGNGEIDRGSQRRYKEKLVERWNGGTAVVAVGDLVRVTWEDLTAVVHAVHDAIVDNEGTTDSARDFEYVDLERKNELNGMAKVYADEIVEHHLPFFGEIDRLLKNPASKALRVLYHEVIDEMRFRLAGDPGVGGRVTGQTLNALYDTVVERAPDNLSGRRRVLRVVLSFMYVNCDLGLKHEPAA